MKRAISRGLDAVFPKCRERSLGVPRAVRRVLLVRVNYRLGNTVLATSLLPVLRARFPAATIDMLVGNSTVRLLDGLGLNEVFTVARDDLRVPWRLVSLLRQLRRRNFEVAVDGGMNSFSGALYGWLAGAEWRIGARGPNDRFLNVRLDLPRSLSVYDIASDAAHALGVKASGWPDYSIAASEARAASRWIDQWQLEAGLGGASFLGAFVGGHAHKRWPRSRWLSLLARLNAEKIAVLVFAGPEEKDFADVLRAQAWTWVRVAPPNPLRELAALMARVSVLITPDSGPMHLAAALGVPVLALLQTDRSRFYVPTGNRNMTLVSPQTSEVVAAIRKLGAIHPDRKPAPLYLTS